RLLDEFDIRMRQMRELDTASESAGQRASPRCHVRISIFSGDRVKCDGQWRAQLAKCAPVRAATMLHRFGEFLRQRRELRGARQPERANASRPIKKKLSNVEIAMRRPGSPEKILCRVPMAAIHHRQVRQRLELAPV